MIKQESLVPRHIDHTPTNNEVFVVRASLDHIQEPMDELVSSFRVRKSVHSVAIKVNLCDYRTADSGATSDPRVVEALIRSIKLIYDNPHIDIVETDASGTNCDSLYSFLGFKRLEKELGVTLVNLRRSTWTDVPLDGRFFKKIQIPRIVADADLFVNHPKLKTHGKTKITVGLKNIFGCLRQRYKARYHQVLDDAIVDANRAIISDLVVVDGIIALEGWGPTYGLPKHLGLLMGGRSVVSVDAFCADLMGFGAKSVAHVALAEKMGLGSTRYELRTELDETFLGKCRFKFDPVRYLLRGLAESQIS